ncbi:myoglobin-like [Anopheles arabiensis]|uniref:AGAP008434-PA n=2 Tax=gambiae species complex TaxID=44542 RepID=Q5TQA4_ANOGA|nr:myoglobin-like [Anopheles arabiensis]XP_040171100.1 myoglobin-like [Anopheles arabiensis]XP_040171101.1 myoglobin-like [Anopheles arabiensis]EAL39570.1 AGAP008434-PA [Anopheles gambiae str. PEST]CAJ65692.1 globin 2 [Anopheles gambiae]
MDQTGLTASEKITLFSAWGLIRKDLDVHGRNVLLLLFHKHPRYIAYFDFTDDPNAQSLVDNKSLYDQAIHVFKAVGALIEYGFKDPVLFDATLRKITRRHKDRPVYTEDILTIGEVLLNYLEQALGRQMSDSLPDAFWKLFQTIAGRFPATPKTPIADEGGDDANDPQPTTSQRQDRASDAP